MAGCAGGAGREAGRGPRGAPLRPLPGGGAHHVPADQQVCPPPPLQG